MATRDLVNDIDPIQVLNGSVTTGGGNTSAVDLKAFESCTFIFLTGTAANSATMGIAIQDSDEAASGFTAAVDKFLIGSESDIGFSTAHATNNDNLVQKIGYKGPKRYVRAAITVGGSTTPLTAIALRGHPHLRPKPEPDNAPGFNEDHRS